SGPGFRGSPPEDARTNGCPATLVVQLVRKNPSPSNTAPRSAMSGFQPFEIIPGDPSHGLVILADHAMNRVPPEYGDLGLPPEAFSRHIAYDIGVEGVTRDLSARLGVPAVLACFSRLLIDPNRGEDDPTLIMKLSDGMAIPAKE